MKFKIQNTKSKIILLVTSYLLLVTILGCEAFVRKFTRKPKKESLTPKEMVLVPEEYKGPQMSKEDLYRQHLLFWKSWHSELIESLSKNASHKKQIYCANEAIKNLELLRTLLNEEKQKKLDIYIGELTALLDLIKEDLYGNSIAINRQKSEQIKRNILRDFSYSKIKDYLI